MRNISGREDYLRAHIPTAGFADLKGELSDSASAIEFAPPSPTAFCEAMGRLGVGDDTRVVLYDNSYGAWAARVWWMLKWVGFERAALLDGGLSVWKGEGRPVTSDTPVHPPRTLTPRPQEQLIAHKAEVKAALKASQLTLIDTLPEPFFTGETAMYARPGHIPGAVNLPGPDVLDADGRFRPEAELREIFKDIPDQRAITYCGGGILASLTAFVMARLGYGDIAVYTASLQEWAADTTCPMVTGPE